MKQTFTKLFAKPLRWKSQRVCAGILTVYCLAGPKQAQAQDYFIKDDFRTNSSANFRVGGNASLTSTTSTGDGGYLRLTSAATNQKGFAISKQTFNPVNGFSISFEYFSYGGTTTDSFKANADGISLFLVDGTIVTNPDNFVPGGYGGSLGYAQLGTSPITPGATGGFIGIGLDEFGGYSWNNEAKNGGTSGRVISGVAIRGAGNASTTAYPYITGAATGTYTYTRNASNVITSRTLSSGFSIDVATARAQSTSADYRRVFVDVFPTSKGAATYKVTVRIQNGSTISTVIDNQVFTASTFGTQTMPASLRIGFAASTGGSTNFHEVRDLQIVRPPVANNDVVFTSYRSSTPVTFSPLTNDEASGSSLDIATLDLNPATVEVDATLSVPEGTFAIGSNGAVTFTPSGNFAGTFTVPYTVQSILKSISNQGTITINVTGADIATTLNGPTAVNVGSSVTYTTTTSNVGIEAGSNVVPKLVLTGDVTITQQPANSSITTSGTGTTKVTTITFAAIPSLSPSDTPIDNPVAFTLNSGSVTGASSFTTAVPDPSTANNAASLATGGYSLTGISNGCGGPGKDGPGPVGVTAADGMIINTYFQGQASVTATSKTIALAGSGTGYDTPIMPGDLVLIMQMQGATINSTNTSSYGALTNVTAGIYEYAVAAPNTNVSYADGGTLVLMNGLTNDYLTADATASTGPRRFQVIRVPQYSSYNATTVTTIGENWNGKTGGVLALDVVGNTNFGTSNARVAFNMTGKGFRGGGGVRYRGSATYANGDYVRAATTKDDIGAHGTKGEGIVGTPRYVYKSPTETQDLGAEAYPGGSVGRGAPGNAGGGGADATALTNTGNTGGGGGSNAYSGDSGGKGGNYNTTISGGLGATSPGLSAATRLFMGGGGGAGSASITGVEGSNSGKNGGGIVILRTGTVSGTARITASGVDAGNASANAAGGGGGGGAVLIASNNALTNIIVAVNGGDGGNSTVPVATLARGAGGGGSGGTIYSNTVTSTNSSAQFGERGTSQIGTATPATNGAVSGADGTAVISANQSVGISATLNCRPDLDVFLRTNTPQVIRGENMQATYTLTVVNNGGAATDVRALVTLANGTNASTGGSATGTASELFKYKSTSAATITLADKTVVTLTTTAGALNSYTAPDAASSAPAFSGIDIPAGAILTITFQVDMATTAVNNIPYQSGAQVSYLDPARTTASRMLTPGGMYEGTTTAAPGINYVSTSSTGEDVSIARPLPVELKWFGALAIRQDAALTWVTASEKNSNRFEVERSLDGLHFEAVGSVKGQGYSNQEHTYRYTDASAAQRAVSSVVYYRLRQIDADGADAYSGVEAVRFEKSVQTAIRLYPNPAQAQATLDLREVPAGNYQVQILDMTGRVLSQQTLSGKQVHELSTTALAPGSYVVQVSGNSVQLALRLLHN